MTRSISTPPQTSVAQSPDSRPSLDEALDSLTPAEREALFASARLSSDLNRNVTVRVSPQTTESDPALLRGARVQLTRRPGETDEEFRIRQEGTLLSLNTGQAVEIDVENPDTEMDDDTPGADSTGGEIIVSRNRSIRNLDDWRVRLSLAPGSRYLYKAENAGILEPLAATNGVIFPYTPQISVNYAANYNATDLVHSNFKVFQYNNSSVDNVNIVCDFTAQDTKEARYLLAVIHFFRSATKMFFGQDENPIAGTPPPLCFLRGMGEYQFSDHPLVISNFSYTLPNDVDYINTTGTSRSSLVEQSPSVWNSARIPTGRLPDIIREGGTRAEPNFKKLNIQPEERTTYVPSKITLNISCIPVVSRASMADKYSTRDYANGTIYRRSGGSFW